MEQFGEAREGAEIGSDGQDLGAEQHCGIEQSEDEPSSSGNNTSMAMKEHNTLLQEILHMLNTKTS